MTDIPQTFDDPTANCQPGDIIKGKKNKNRNRAVPPHAIVYLGADPNDRNIFYGAMLTTSGAYTENIAMRPDHFRDTDKNGLAFSFTYKNTKVVHKLFIKKMEWKPFFKVGELTEKGLGFVQELMKDRAATYYDGNA